MPPQSSASAAAASSLPFSSGWRQTPEHARARTARDPGPVRRYVLFMLVTLETPGCVDWLHRKRACSLEHVLPQENPANTAPFAAGDRSHPAPEAPRATEWQRIATTVQTAGLVAEIG